MSNKTQLQTNNTNLASYTDRVSALIDVANSLPEAGGSSGGGNIETCNVYITMGIYTDGRYAVYTTLDESGNMTTAVLNNCGNTAVPLNCVCNTPIMIYRNDSYGTSIPLRSDLSVLCSNASQGIYIFDGGVKANSDYWIRFDIDAT